MIEVNANLGDLSDIDLITKLPSNNDVLTYNSNTSKWVPKQTIGGGVNSSPTSTYVIELNRWNIKNDGTNSASTTTGINDVLVWAKSQRNNHVVLKSGTYGLKMDPATFSCIKLSSNLHFDLEDGCVF